MKKFEDFNLEPVLNVDQIVELQNLVKHIRIDRKMAEYIIRIIDATRFPEKYNLEIGKYIGTGASPRASISLFLASKARALMNNKIQVTPEEIRGVAKNVLRHRIIVNFEGQAENIKTDDIIDEIIFKVKIL